MFGKNSNQILLVTANMVMVFFLIVLSNFGVLPMRMGDFVFFSILALALALYRPGWAFLFFVGTIVLENINLAPGELGIAIRPYQFFGGITILALIVRLATKRLNFTLTKFILQDYLAIAMVLASFLSVVNSSNKGVSLKQSIVLASFVGLYFLARNFIQTKNDIKKVIPFFLSSSIIVIGYGIWQNVRFAQGLSNFEVMPGRPNATFTEPDWLGTFITFIIAMIYGLLFYINKRKDEINRDAQIFNFQFLIFKQFLINKFQIFKTFLYLLLIAIYMLLIITVSRSAWLGAIGATFIFLFSVFTQLKIKPKNWQWKEAIRQKLFIISALVIALAGTYFFHLTSFQLFNRVQSTSSGLQKITIACDSKSQLEQLQLLEQIEHLEQLDQFSCRHINLEDIENEKSKGGVIGEVYRKDPNVSIRSEIYKKSWKLIKTHPILGIGWGNIGSYLGNDERGSELNASNIFFEVWLGAGILGLISFVFFLGIILFRSLGNFTQNDFETKSIGMFLLLGIFAIIIPNLFNSGIFLGYLWLFFGSAFNNKREK